MTPPVQTELDFAHGLPAGREFFTVLEISRVLGCSVNHVANWIEAGELEVALDLRGKSSSRAMWRVPRPTIIAFLNRRKS